MSRLIDADKLIEKISYQFVHSDGRIDFDEVKHNILTQPTVVTDSYIEQLRWERDVAISQLEELGIEFGEKVDDKVVVAKMETTTRSKGNE